MTKWLYGLTIFSGAMLLFSVQPMIGKYILPWFGGGPAVWTTCMLFFQLVLLAGYAYAHLNIRLFKPTTGAIVHFVLLLASLVVLPIIPNPVWRPQDAADPTWRIMLLLAATLGLPYMVLASTSPLLQAWIGRINPGKTPYRLYSLSNIGSLLALISYPFLIEPNIARTTQAWVWSIGMVAYVVLCSGCAFVALRARKLPESSDEPRGEEGLLLAQSAQGAGNASAAGTNQPQPSENTTSAAPPVIPVEATLGVRLLWLALPACAVVLLLAVTNALADEAGAVPFLWVMPLSIYLLTFIICFDHERWYKRWHYLALSVLAVAGLGWFMGLDSQHMVVDLLKLFGFLGVRLTAGWIALVIFFAYLSTLFITCMTCHGELYRLKPAVKHLTGYYLMISAGGAIGGVLVAIVAPRVFSGYFELHIGLLACLVLAALAIGRDPKAKEYRAYVWGGVSVACVLLGPLLYNAADFGRKNLVAARRNFYGTLVVVRQDEHNARDNMYAMYHGRTSHGQQLLAPDRRALPTAYFGLKSGVGRALQAVKQPHRRIAVIGQGVGTLAVYAKPGDFMRFYEINPQVDELARKYFTFMDDCSAKMDVELCDARLALEREAPQQYDLLIVDAFSGDSIPTHLVTKEAFDIYMRHLKPDGVLVVQLTNKYYDLQPIVWRLGKEEGLKSVFVRNVPEDLQRGPLIEVPSSWMLLSRNAAIFDNPEIKGAGTNTPYPDAPLWTDEKSSLLGVLRH